MDERGRRQPEGGVRTKDSVIHNLQQIVSENEHDVKKGVVPLCLTPEVLLILNHGFEHLTDTRVADQKLSKDLNYLQHALNSTKYLRLSHGGNSTIQAPVNLTTFHSLSQLDVKKLPPHWILGLDMFKDKLTLIRMSRSINFLEDLLGKISEDASHIHVVWSKLRKLYLSNNFIRELDESLKLVPCLEVLDLSQNYLTHTDDKLQYLTELEHVNMAYNSLTTIPSFSTLAFSKMKTLVLRSNHLEHINGVEVLENLETLDMTSNILCDHGVLHPLRGLTLLTQLYLEENPLSFNRSHRPLTGANLHPMVLNKVSLDGQEFSDVERKDASERRAKIRTPPLSPVNAPQSMFSSQSASSTVSPVQSASTSPSVKRRVRSTVVNEITEIPQPSDDMDSKVMDKNDESLLSDVSAVTSVQNSPSKGGPGPTHTKSRIETLREEFGDSWLQSFNGVSPPVKTAYTQSTNSSEKEVSQSGQVSTDDLPIRDDEPDDVTGPASQYGSVIDEGSISILEESGSKYNSLDEESSVSETARPATNGDGPAIGDLQNDGHESDNSSTFSVESIEEDDEEISEHEPFVVKRPTEESEEFWLSVTKTQLVEKDIEGHITEMLDLSALLDVQKTQQDDGHHIVECKFDYFRKDRRMRSYVMDDESDATRLVCILQPIVEESQSVRKTTDTMECLKCSKQFELKKNSRIGSRADCIHCGSELVIDVSSALNSQSTPYGSMSSNSSSTPVTKPLRSRASQIKLSSDESHTFSESYASAISDITSPAAVYVPAQLDSEDHRLRSGTDATDSTIEPGEGSNDDIGGAPSLQDEETQGSSEAIAVKNEKRDMTESITPNSTISYQSFDGETPSPASSTPGAADDQTDAAVGGQQQHSKDTLTGFRFDQEDLSYIDHRLKLHLTVSYFCEDEQTQCVLRCKCVEYTRPEEYPTVLVMTNVRLYIFRVHPVISKRLDVGPQLELIYKDLLSSIHYMEIGLDHQNIRIEFEKAGYCLLIRDINLGRQFHAKLTEMMSEAIFNDVSNLKSITKIYQEYYQHIGKCTPDISRDMEEQDKINATYCTAFKITQDEYNIDLLQGCQPVSLIVDETSIYIVREMYHLPFTRNRLSKKQTYFNHENTIPIIDVTHLDVNNVRHQVDVVIDVEETSLELVHKLAFVSPTSMQNFVDLLKSPWKALYSVDLQINHTNSS